MCERDRYLDTSTVMLLDHMPPPTRDNESQAIVSLCSMSFSTMASLPDIAIRSSEQTSERGSEIHDRTLRSHIEKADRHALHSSASASGTQVGRAYKDPLAFGSTNSPRAAYHTTESMAHTREIEISSADIRERAREIIRVISSSITRTRIFSR